MSLMQYRLSKLHWTNTRSARLVTPVLTALLLQLPLSGLQMSSAASKQKNKASEQAQIKADATSSSGSDSDESTLAEAESLYWEGSYEEALPLYLKLADLSGDAKNICDSPVKLHNIANLGDCYARMNDYEKALPLYERILDAREKQYGKNSLETAMDITRVGACYYYLDKFDKAERLCEKGLEILNKSNSPNSDLVAKVCLELGEIYYAQAKFDEAARAYERAVHLYDQSQGDVLEQLIFALQGEAACYYHDKQYDQAAPILERLADIDCTIHGSTDVRYGWALLNLSDVYRKLGQHDKAGPIYEKCVQIFRRVNIERILAEEEAKGNMTPEVRGRIFRHMFGHLEDEKIEDLQSDIEQHRKTAKAMICRPSEKSLAKMGPWNLVTTDRIDPPAWLWMNPRVRQRATLVCVHGLGLNARTYEAFARAISRRGITVLALDMRGFGTYASLKGKDRADFEGSLEDLTTILTSMRRGRSGTPTFILGESMGGAIALQFAAKHPELIDGLICSVPSGSRYKAKKTDLKVAVKFLADANKPFDIGKEIVNQATAKDSLKRAWENDPFNRLELTPKELVEFQSFMNQNKSAANKIKDRPVLFFQGAQDKLIKTEGTVGIFKEIASQDKDLVVLGTSEHLIFEEGQFGPSVVFGVLGWVLAHIPDQEKWTASN